MKASSDNEVQQHGMAAIRRILANHEKPELSGDENKRIIGLQASPTGYKAWLKEPDGAPVQREGEELTDFESVQRVFIWGEGESEREAIGDLVWSHPELFQVVVETDEQYWDRFPAHMKRKFDELVRPEVLGDAAR